jgi:hypothetical protein
MDREPLLTAPSLLSAFRRGPAEFEIAATEYAEARRRPAMDAGSEECIELLDHVVERLAQKENPASAGMEEACVYLLEHLAARFQNQKHQAGSGRRKGKFIQ